MTAPQRDAIASAARTILANVQAGYVDGVRGNTIPAVAADFSGIAASITSLAPLILNASVTVDNAYLLDASTEPQVRHEPTSIAASPWFP